ncbi:MAG: hypothetical protein EBS29_00845 [Chloroflexia bacterium]|nr:hypothetical protein [Chloroflexia bacterium]
MSHPLLPLLLQPRNRKIALPPPSAKLRPPSPPPSPPPPLPPCNRCQVVVKFCFSSSPISSPIVSPMPLFVRFCPRSLTLRSPLTANRLLQSNTTISTVFG